MPNTRLQSKIKNTTIFRISIPLTIESNKILISSHKEIYYIKMCLPFSTYKYRQHPSVCNGPAVQSFSLYTLFRSNIYSNQFQIYVL